MLQALFYAEDSFALSQAYEFSWYMHTVCMIFRHRTPRADMRYWRANQRRWRLTRQEIHSLRWAFSNGPIIKSVANTISVMAHNKALMHCNCSHTATWISKPGFCWWLWDADCVGPDLSHVTPSIDLGILVLGPIIYQGGCLFRSCKQCSVNFFILSLAVQKICRQ